MATVEQKHLAELTFKTSKPVKGEDGKKRFIPQERKLTLADLLDQRDQGDTFIVVTKDGKKYVIPKADGKPGKNDKTDGKAEKDARAGGGDGE